MFITSIQSPSITNLPEPSTGSNSMLLRVPANWQVLRPLQFAVHPVLLSTNLDLSSAQTKFIMNVG